ncbi:VOC family protein [Sphingobacterium corticis]|uniref:VOC family protein n=1 Tax=Sphingobacterium corticis TaxID=1812823 RepID=A0ABW5NMT4_9SPHI
MIANPYLNFDGKTEEAFRFYQSIFGTELSLQFMHEVPNLPVSDEEKNYVMHASLPINDQQQLMASDCLTSQGHVWKPGNNVSISLTPDSREDADRLYNGLSEGGTVEMPMEDAFWGDYFGSFTDKFGVQWMINFPNS